PGLVGTPRLDDARLLDLTREHALEGSSGSHEESGQGGADAIPRARPHRRHPVNGLAGEEDEPVGTRRDEFPEAGLEQRRALLAGWMDRQPLTRQGFVAREVQRPSGDQLLGRLREPEDALAEKGVSVADLPIASDHRALHVLELIALDAEPELLEVLLAQHV